MKTFKIAFFALLFMMTGVVSAASLTVVADDAATIIDTSIVGSGTDLVQVNSRTFGEFAPESFTNTLTLTNTSGGSKAFRLHVSGFAGAVANYASFSATLGTTALSLLPAFGGEGFEYSDIVLSAGDSITLVLAGVDFEKASYQLTLATPIPAAVWLFGSALMGLFGVSRRKSTAVAA